MNLQSLLRSRIARDGGWVLGGQVIAAAGALIGTRLVTEVVPRVDYGAVSLLIGAVTLARGMFCVPILQAGLRLFPEFAAVDQVPMLRAVLRRLLSSTTLLLVIILLISGSFAGPRFGVGWTPFVLLATTLIFDVARTFELDLLSAARRQKTGSIWRASEAIFRPLLIVGIVVVFGASVNAILSAQALTAASLLCIFYVVSRREGASAASTSILPEQNRAMQSQVIQYAAPLIPLALFGWISGLSDRYIIGGQLGADQVGLYAATYGLVSQPFLIAQTVIELTLRPVYFQAVAVGEETKELRVFRVWLAITAGVSITIFAGVLFFRRIVAFLLLSADYRGGYELMPWIAGGYILFCLATVLERPAYAHKRTGWIPVSQGGGALACLVFEILLIRLYGLKGAAMAVPCYYGVHAILALLAARVVFSRSSVAQDDERRNGVSSQIDMPIEGHAVTHNSSMGSSTA